MQHDSLFAKAQKYLRSAALLLEMEDYDSSVSRSYLAMFYAAQAVLMHDGVRVTSRLSIRADFRRRYVETGVLPDHAARIFQEAADLKEVADYAHDHAIGRLDAERILQEAEAFVNSLARLIVQYR